MTRLANWLLTDHNAAQSGVPCAAKTNAKQYQREQGVGQGRKQAPPASRAGMKRATDIAAPKSRRRATLLGSVMALALVLPSLQQALAAPVVSGQSIRDFNRVTFEWPQSTRIESRMEGNKLIVTFDRRASGPDFTRLLSHLPKIVRKAEVAEDARGVVLTLDKPYRIRSFVSGNMNGVDLMAQAAKTEEVAASKPVPVETAKLETAKLETAKAEPVPNARTPASEENDTVQAAPVVPVEKKLPQPKTPIEAALKKEPVAPVVVQAEEESEAEEQPVPAPRAPEKPVLLPEPRKKPKPPEVEAKKPAIPEASKPETEKPEPAKEKTPTPEIAPPETPKPAPEEAAKPAPEPVKAPSVIYPVPKLRPAPEHVDTTVRDTGAAPPEAAKPETPAVPVEPAAPAEKTTAQLQAEKTAAEAKLPLPVVKLPAAPTEATKLALQFTRQGDALMLNFPWTQRTAAAMFQRGDTFWIIFDHLATIQPENLEPARGLLTDISGSTASGHTILRLHAPNMHGMKAQQASGSLGWQVVLTPQGQWPESTPGIQAHTEEGQPSYLLVAALETAPAVTVPDPDLKDNLLIVPSYSVGQGIAPARHMVELDLLASAQGIVIQPEVDGIAVSQQRNGLRIGTPEGLRLSKNLPGSAASKQDGSNDAALPSLFAVADWPGGVGSGTAESIPSIQARLMPMMREKGAVANEARKQMAQAYLAQGLAPEALGQLDLLRESDLDYYIREKLSALSGLANFIMYRMPEAARDFSVPELQASEEAEYWRTILAELNGRSDELFDYVRFNARYMHQYPQEVRRRLAIIAVDRLIAKSRYNEAVAVLSGLRKDKLIDKKTSPAVDYLLGETLARTGFADKATELWKPLTQNMDDRYWRARAEYALINLELTNGKITEADAIPRLDHLRILWRDDPLELQVLMQLSELQLKEKQYRDALRTLREITLDYPNTQAAFDAAQKMAETFVTLFNGDGAKAMKPLDALALYYEFKDLTPVEEAGDVMIRNLSDRLAEVDLLDRAAALLEHQVKFRLQGEERSRVGARLALLYLLNRQPQKALDELELTGYGANTEELERKRALLTARALADLKEGDRAIALLEDDTSLDAQLLKVDVRWDQGNWPELSHVGEAILGARRDPTAQLTDTEMGVLLKLAVAYSFQRDTEQLRYLRDYFGPLVQQSPQKDLFHFLTNDAPISPDTIAQLSQNISEMQSFLSRWRNQVKDKGLSETVK